MIAAMIIRITIPVTTTGITWLNSRKRDTRKLRKYNPGIIFNFAFGWFFLCHPITLNPEQTLINYRAMRLNHPFSGFPKKPGTWTSPTHNLFLSVQSFVYFERLSPCSSIFPNHVRAEYKPVEYKSKATRTQTCLVSVH